MQLNGMPNAVTYETLMQNMNLPQASYVQAVTSLATSVSDLEQRIGCWENFYLPHLLDRLPAPAPRTPLSPVDQRPEGDAEPPTKRPMTTHLYIPRQATAEEERHVSNMAATEEHLGNAQPMEMQETQEYPNANDNVPSTPAETCSGQQQQSSAPAVGAVQDPAPTDQHVSGMVEPKRDSHDQQEGPRAQDGGDMMEHFREKSLRSCCAKVVQDDPRQPKDAGAKPPALKPFKACS